MDNHEVAQIDNERNIDNHYAASVKKPKSLGGLKLRGMPAAQKKIQSNITEIPERIGLISTKIPNKPDNSEASEDYIIRFSKGRNDFNAETLLANYEHNKSAPIDRVYFGIGADKKEKLLGFRIRLAY